MQKEIKNLKIEKLVFGGQGLARHDDKTIFVWNALPGEVVDVVIVKKKKELIQAVATNIVKASPDRIKPTEEHYLSCSPWQIMNMDHENFWKIETVKEVFQKFAKVDLGQVQIDYLDPAFAYRNKIEYSFWGRDDDTIGFAFFARGQKYKISIDDCALASDPINKTAAQILAWINENKLPRGSLKSLIVRSNLAGQTIAALFIKDEMDENNVILSPSKEGEKIKTQIKDFPKLDKDCLGFQLYYSTHKSPASVPTKLLYSYGQDFLTEKINQVELKYGLLSFFQVNIPVFEKSLDDIEKFIEPNVSLLDLYCGVGSIGLPLANKVKDLVLVEENEQAIEYCQQNIKQNKLQNCIAYLSQTEKMLELIKEDKTIIVDPPRAGLHQKVVERLLQVKPKTLIYLSCNISTQARDFDLLQSDYKIKFFKLYNFFPRTPHVEALLVLERR